MMWKTTRSLGIVAAYGAAPGNPTEQPQYGRSGEESVAAAEE